MALFDRMGRTTTISPADLDWNENRRALPDLVVQVVPTKRLHDDVIGFTQYVEPLTGDCGRDGSSGIRCFRPQIPDAAVDPGNLRREHRRGIEQSGPPDIAGEQDRMLVCPEIRFDTH